MTANDDDDDDHPPMKNADLSFPDGNIVVLASSVYFVVHQGLLIRHSEVLQHLIITMDKTPAIEGRPVLSLPEQPDSIACLLKALYDGISFLTCDQSGFKIVASLLRVLTTYKVHRLRQDVLRVLSTSWPTTLSQWEARECNVRSPDDLPHPIEVINLARDIDALSLLPSAMYDLSRSTPSAAAIGVFDPQLGDYITLDDTDLSCVLRGRELASRYFSTFIVKELEGRLPSVSCLRRNDPHPVAKRACQIAFEAITFELLRDINGIINQRTSDPLFAMSEAEDMQTRDGASEDNIASMRTCEACRVDFSAAVITAKRDFWSELPRWFGVAVPEWS